MTIHEPYPRAHFTYTTEHNVEGFVGVSTVRLICIGDIGRIGLSFDHSWHILGDPMPDRDSVFTTREKAAQELEYRHFHNLRLFKVES